MLGGMARPLRLLGLSRLGGLYARGPRAPQVDPRREEPRAADRGRGGYGSDCLVTDTMLAAYLLTPRPPSFLWAPERAYLGLDVVGSARLRHGALFGASGRTTAAEAAAGRSSRPVMEQAIDEWPPEAG